MKYLKLLTLSFLIAGNIFANTTEYAPWYTGPVLALSAYNIPPKSINIQPYLYVLDTYGEYHSAFAIQSSSSELTVNPTMLVETGITNWLDITLNIQTIYNQKSGQNAFGYGDTRLDLGFQLTKEDKQEWTPALRLLLSEFFPTGKYKKLNDEKLGVDAMGSGAFSTIFKFIMSKVLYWIPSHPMQYRINLSYSLPTNVHVKGFNAYGGGFNTDGTVKPGHIFSTIFSLEFSFTQRWVFATDILYNFTTKTSFSGTPGTTATGAEASNTSSNTTRISITPSIEYNFSKNLGAIAGVWVSVYVNNTKKFYGGVISVTYTW